MLGFGSRHGYRALQASMADPRGGEVVFVSHCLLNQNTRYLGGATCAGAVSSAIDQFVDEGTGIVQLACPEQRVWGGVLKRRMLWLIEHPYRARPAAFAWPVVRRYLHWRYRHLARAVAADLADYRASGMSVRGVVGVADSPSCGVHTTVDLPRAVAAIGRRDGSATAEWMNTVVAGARRPGPGIFIAELDRAMRRRGLETPLIEHSLRSVPPKPSAGGGRP